MIYFLLLVGYKDSPKFTPLKHLLLSEKEPVEILSEIVVPAMSKEAGKNATARNELNSLLFRKFNINKSRHLIKIIYHFRLIIKI